MNLKALLEASRILVLHYGFAFCRIISGNNPHLAKFMGKALLYMISGFIINRKFSDKINIEAYYRSQSYNSQYRIWLRNQNMIEMDWFKIKLDYRPKISLVMPVYNSDEKWLNLAIQSVINQKYQDWELCIVDDKSESLHVRRILEKYSTSNSKIKTVFLEKHEGISQSTNEGIKKCTGDFIGFIDHDDELYPDALYHVVSAINDNPSYKIFYTDEDKLTTDGKRIDPFFKPDWSPELLLSCNYINHFIVYEKNLLHSVGLLRKEYDGSQDYDLILRASELTDKIFHIAKPLYGWRKAKGSTSIGPVKHYAFDAAIGAITDAMKRRKIQCKVEMPVSGYYRCKFTVDKKNSISIIVVNDGNEKKLQTFLKMLKSKTSYNNYEITIIDKSEHKLVGHDVIVESFLPRAFNIALNKCSGDHIVFLSTNLKIIHNDWLEALLELSCQPQIGAVGPVLLNQGLKLQPYTICSAGLTIGVNGVASHSFRNMKFDNGNYFMFNRIIRNVSAIEVQCLMVKRSIIQAIGGFDENYGCLYGIDLCLRIRQAGYRNTITPFAKIISYDSNDFKDAHDLEYFSNKWKKYQYERDEYYNSNLTLLSDEFGISPLVDKTSALSILLELYYVIPTLKSKLPKVQSNNYDRLIDWLFQNDKQIISFLGMYKSYYTNLKNHGISD